MDQGVHGGAPANPYGLQGHRDCGPASVQLALALSRKAQRVKQ